MSKQAATESKDVADFLLDESRERGEPLTNLKLQKLLYYADAWYLALHDRPLFAESFQAWVHGPVHVEQYQRFKAFQWRPIDSAIERPNLDKKVTNHLLDIVDLFGSETAVALEIMTHRELPWVEARGELSSTEPSQASISKKTTKKFYRNMQ